MSKTFIRFPMWLQELISKSKSKLMLEAAYMYMLMLDRAELSIATGWYDHENKVYIHFTYEETKSILKCGTTKCWKIYKLLKELKLISVKPQGFGYALMIYVHTPDLSLETKAEENRSTLPSLSLEQLKNRYADIFDGSCFTDEQLSLIEKKICTLIPDENEGERRAFLRNLYARLLKKEENTQLYNPFAYFLKMLENSKYKKHKVKYVKDAPKQEHSYDLDALIKFALENPPPLIK